MVRQPTGGREINDTGTGRLPVSVQTTIKEGTRAMTKIDCLKKSIELHSRLYDKGKPLISDAEYDALVKEHSELTGGKGSPVVPPVVGADPVAGSKKITHPAPMLSLKNAFDQEERAALWYGIQRQISDAEGYGDLKVDGMALRIEYLDGKFSRASTRGNGTEGENVTEAALRMQTIPKELLKPVAGRVSVVGEAYMRDDDFTLLNQEREEAGLDLYTSPRNTVAGGMRHSDTNKAAKRRLRFFAYGLLVSENDLGFKLHSEVMHWLSDIGFETVAPAISGIQDANDVEEAFRQLSEASQKVDYACDGVVIKLNGLEGRDTLGLGSTAPNWAYAMKFPATAERTVLMDVTFHVGRTGAITPVGELQPVVIGDVLVSRLTLHNKDMIERLDLRIGDKVLVKRAGDVIPAVEDVFVEERTGDEKSIVFPTTCPWCDNALIRPENEARIYCPNALLCPGQLKRGLEHFVGQDYMAVNGVGPAAISQLVDGGLVKQVPDLYRLTYDDVVSLAGYGDRKAENLLREIDESRRRPLQKLLAALGIREVGRSASEAIVGHYGSLERLLDVAAQEEDAESVEATLMYKEVRALEGFGPKMAESFCNYMRNENNREQLQDLMGLGVSIGVSVAKSEPDSAESGVAPLAGLRVCATGKLAGYSRGEINTRITQLGGSPQGSVTKATDLLVVGDKAGSKLAKARALGIPVLSEQDFEAGVRDDSIRDLCAG